MFHAEKTPIPKVSANEGKQFWMIGIEMPGSIMFGGFAFYNYTCNHLYKEVTLKGLAANLVAWCCHQLCGKQMAKHLRTETLWPLLMQVCANASHLNKNLYKSFFLKYSYEYLQNRNKIT